MECVLYENMTPTAFKQRMKQAPIAYLPLGTLEWHGEHLPLGADGLQSKGFFIELAKRVGGIVLPMLFVGPDRQFRCGETDYYGMDTYANDQKAADDASGKAMTADSQGKMPRMRQLPGSAYWIGEDIFVSLLESILAQLKRAGFRVVVAHGHGPSTVCFAKHIEEWESKYAMRLFNCWGEDPEYGIQCDHAAANETSLVMALEPQLVHMEYLSDDPEVYPVGVGGKDPRFHASPEHGRKCIETQAKRMEGLLREAMGG